MNNKLLRVFTGTEIEVILLQGELEENGISSMTSNGSASVSSTIYGGAPTSLELYINEPDLEKARPIIQEFQKNRDSEK